MIMIEIPLRSAEINGDRGTISLPLEDVEEALKNAQGGGGRENAKEHDRG